MPRWEYACWCNLPTVASDLLFSARTICRRCKSWDRRARMGSLEGSLQACRNQQVGQSRAGQRPLSITNNVQIKPFASENLSPFPFALGSGQHRFLSCLNREHVLTLCKQDFAQLTTFPRFKHLPVLPPSLAFTFQVGRHRDVTLVPLRVAQGVTTLSHPWKKGLANLGWTFPDFFPWVCRHHGNV